MELSYELMSEEERARRQLEAEESNFSALYFQHLQNRSAKTCVHALHIVHALPDLHIAAGRFWDSFLLSCVPLRDCKTEAYFLAPESTFFT